MPRLNHGTLLENLVVHCACRVFGEGDAVKVAEFVTTFAMPPLAQSWHKTIYEPRNNPHFNQDVIAALGAAGPQPLGTYRDFLQRVVVNAPGLPFVPCANQLAPILLNSMGPNGALLCAMWAASAKKPTRVWSNDIAFNLGASYGTAAGPNAGTECPLTTQYARRLLGLDPGSAIDGFSQAEFPGSIADLRTWTGECDLRVGFLDPDSYTLDDGGQRQVGRADHVEWLEAVADRCKLPASIMFFATRVAAQRSPLIAAFHEDAEDLYPCSVVFRYGNYMVGVKWGGAGSCAAGDRLVSCVREGWRGSLHYHHGRAPGPLTVYVNGVQAP